MVSTKSTQCSSQHFRVREAVASLSSEGLEWEEKNRIFWLIQNEVYSATVDLRSAWR